MTDHTPLITAFNHKQGARPRTWIAPDPAEIVKIAEATAVAFGLGDWKLLWLPNRLRIYSEPRFAACLIARKHGHTLRSIAETFKGVTPSIMYGARKAEEIAAFDPEYAAKIKAAEGLYREKIKIKRKEAQCQPD